MSMPSAWAIWGGVVFLAGLALKWRVSRYDMTDKALGSAWQTVRGRRSATNPTELERDLADITGQTTLAGKATRTAGKVAGHFVAQALGLVGLVAMLIGAALAAYGIFLAR